MKPDFGGPFDFAFPYAINASLSLTQTIWALSTYSPNTKLRHLATIPASSIPEPLQDLLHHLYPDIMNLMDQRIPDIFQSGEAWRTDVKVPVKPWSLTRLTRNIEA